MTRGRRDGAKKPFDPAAPIDTGGRAVITDEDLSLAVTLDEFGGPFYVEGMLDWCEMQGVAPTDRDPASFATLAAVAANFMGPDGDSVALSLLEDAPFANQDNGTYKLSGWAIGHQDYLVAKRPATVSYPLEVTLAVIDGTQPARVQAGRDRIHRYAKANGRRGRGRKGVLPAAPTPDTKRRGRFEALVKVPRPHVSDKAPVSLALSSHGDESSVAALLGYCSMRGLTAPASGPYGWARLAEVAVNWLGPDAVTFLRGTDARAERTYVVDDAWHATALDSDDLLARPETYGTVAEIDRAQPVDHQLGLREG